MSPLHFRKRRPLDRKVAYRDARLIVIATEGAKTEKQYFRIFDPRRFRCPRIQVRVIPTEDGKSSPGHVLARLDQYRQEFELGAEDELWLMIDVDRWGEKKLNQVAQEADQKGYLLSVSNPCFECWLLLHFQDIPEERIMRRELTKRLRNSLGSYNKSNLRTDHFTVERITAAVDRARQMDTNPQDRWPQSTGTHVYKVVDGILRSAFPEEG